MLASTGPIKGTPDEWAFEPKLDGWRAIVTVDGSVTARTRTGRDITDSLPDLTPLADVYRGRSLVLDGELVAGKGDARSFYRLAPAVSSRKPAAHRRTAPLAFVAFDLLWDGEDCTRLPYEAPRSRLEALNLRGDHWCLAPSFREIGDRLFVACHELGLEGVVAKKLTSRYKPGERSPSWVKVKTPEWRAVHGPKRLSER